MRIHLVTIGDEILLGRTSNTHVEYIGRKLAEHGMETDQQTTVKDDPAVLEPFLRKAIEEADAVIATGGLGPTGDDNTKDVVARIFEKNVRRDQSVLDDLAARYGSVSEIVKTQADVPEDTFVMTNNVGTAPGFIFTDGGKTVLCLPGPPREMQPMFDEHVLPYLTGHFGGKGVFVSRTLRTIGIRESDIETRIAQPLKAVKGLVLGLCAHTFNVDVRISTRAGTRDEGNRILDAGEAVVRAEVEEYIYTDQVEEIEAVLGRTLRERGLTIATAESCTGGLIGNRITDVSGSSEYFVGGMVSYSNDWKIDILGVPREIIERHGAVSSETAKAMAEKIRERSGASIGVATTGIAGPTGGTKEKPVGLVYVAVGDGNGTEVEEHRFGTRGREFLKRLTSQAALALLWRRLSGGPA